ncbi:MAG: hypothetical protein JW864_11060 [Spirochaetes bacterium]|nr:hypothetical protein [Spirochaetota bacterium]
MKSFKTYFFIVLFLLVSADLRSGTISGAGIKSVSMHVDQYIDCANLEYDDSPYAGRTNLGHLFIPYFKIDAVPVELNLGCWYKHVYVQYDEDESPEKVYPYMNAVFHPSGKVDFTIGNWLNLAVFPNTIYNEFIFFETRPVCSGLKLDVNNKTMNLSLYIDWIELDTEDHPEEFITGLLWKHRVFDHFYYKLFNHYHHRGGQLYKDTHPVRIEQDIAASPVLGAELYGFYAEAGYYINSFSQNFEESEYGHAGSGTIGYRGDFFNISYQCFYNKNYYHQDAHIFYLKQNNFLNRLRVDYNFFTYKDLADVNFTVNLYGLDPPGIDFRLFAKINLNVIQYTADTPADIDENSAQNSGGIRQTPEI